MPRLLLLEAVTAPEQRRPPLRELEQRAQELAPRLEEMMQGEGLQFVETAREMKGSKALHFKASS